MKINGKMVQTHLRDDGFRTYCGWVIRDPKRYSVKPTCKVCNGTANRKGGAPFGNNNRRKGMALKAAQ